MTHFTLAFSYQQWKSSNSIAHWSKIFIFVCKFNLCTWSEVHYLILSMIKYSIISSNFGAKIQIYLKLKFCQNWNFWQKLDFYYSVWDVGNCSSLRSQRFDILLILLILLKNVKTKLFARSLSVFLLLSTLSVNSLRCQVTFAAILPVLGWLTAGIVGQRCSGQCTYC